MKYRKKVDVEAFQYKLNLDNGQYCLRHTPDWVFQAFKDGILYYRRLQFEGRPTLLVDTLKGTQIVNVGDYIIRGSNGELYPCRSDIFEMTYDPVIETKENNK